MERKRLRSSSVQDRKKATGNLPVQSGRGRSASMASASASASPSTSSALSFSSSSEFNPFDLVADPPPPIHLTPDQEARRLAQVQNTLPNGDVKVKAEH